MSESLDIRRNFLFSFEQYDNYQNNNHFLFITFLSVGGHMVNLLLEICELFSIHNHFGY